MWWLGHTCPHACGVPRHVRTFALPQCHPLGSGHTCSHTCHVPVPLPTDLGTPIHTFTMCQCRPATWQPRHDFSHIPVLPSSDLGTLGHTCYVSRAATWLPAHTCLHTCCVSTLALGGPGILFACLQCLGTSTCLFTSEISRGQHGHIMSLGNGIGAHMSACISM